MTEPFRPPAAWDGPAFDVHRPALPAAPIVLASPHSGSTYPDAFAAISRLSSQALRRSEDCFVDALCLLPQPDLPHIAARFPRAWCDPNRAAWELDPAMFHDALPSWVQTDSARVRAGLGTIARVVGSGEAIYRTTLSFQEAVCRIETCWKPYHAELGALLTETTARCGAAVLVDCHSMPSAGGNADVVLGDAHGTACGEALIRTAETAFRHQGWRVRRNDPYAGGYVTRHYGRPRNGVHALQIEVARRLYMDEQRLERLPCFNDVQTQFARVIRALAACANNLRQTAPA